MNNPGKSVYSVLVADDDAEDRYLLQRAVRHTTQLQIIGEVADGADAIAYLKGDGEFSDRMKYPLPDLLLLDLKMPRIDGFEVLEWLQTQYFTGLTVVVLTDSMQPEHVKRALDLGADFFQVKPMAKHDRDVMVLAMEDYLTSLGNSGAAGFG